MKPSLTRTQPIDPTLVAPCGLTCQVCRAYGRPRNPCPGCRVEDAGKAPSCQQCRIKDCERLAQGDFTYCFECDLFPCERLVHLDVRYRLRYATSPIQNLETIRDQGIRVFIEGEGKKWTCPQCGSLLSMHKPVCATCGFHWMES